MTPKQKRVLDYITTYFERAGCAPTFSEISEGLGIKSKSQAHRFVSVLIKEGHLVRNGQGARGIVPTSTLSNTCVPLVLHALERSLQDFDEGVITADGVVSRMRPLPKMLRSSA